MNSGLLQGKSISSANATKHGLSAGFRVLSNENQQEFDELVAEYHRTFAPTNTHEQFLVEEMVQSRWRLARIRRLEAALVEQMVGLGDPADSDAVLAAALLDNTAGPFKTLQRYAAAAERSYYRALKYLQDTRKREAQAAEDSARRNEPNSGVSPDANSTMADESSRPEPTENNPPLAAESRCPCPPGSASHHLSPGSSGHRAHRRNPLPRAHAGSMPAVGGRSTQRNSRR